MQLSFQRINQSRNLQVSIRSGGIFGNRESHRQRNMIPAKRITKEQFDDALGRYANLIKQVSGERKEFEDELAEQPGGKYRWLKKDKPLLFGRATLEELDKFRFEEAPRKYCQPDPEHPGKRLIIPLTLKDFRKLMAWKFFVDGWFGMQRMQTVTANTKADVTNTSKAAFELYEEGSSHDNNGGPSLPTEYSSTLNKLAALSGICQESYSIKTYRSSLLNQPDIITEVQGLSSIPYLNSSRASLLLSVHDKDNVIHFADEVYSWLCLNGLKNGPFKYTCKEYDELMTGFRELREILGGEINATDVEKVGFVFMVEKRVRERREREEKRARKGLEMSEALKRLNDEAGAFANQGANGEGRVDGEPRRSKRTKI